MARVDMTLKAIESYVAKNYKEAYTLFKKSVKDSPEAAYYLGLMYYYGFYVDIDDNLAFSYFKQAWEGLYEEGIYMLGRMYEEGRGIIKNYEQAYKLYQAAYKSENAKLRLANFYEYGKYVEKNVVEAIKIYNELQKNNNPFAMYKIGAFYLSGEGLKKDLNNAYKWLNKALLAGSIEAMNHFRILGTKSKTDVRTTEEVFSQGEALVKKRRVEEAVPYLEAAALENCLQAMVLLYKIYHDGLEFDQDYFKSFEILKKYEFSKEPEIYYLLGLSYELGEGVDSSYPKAASYYLKASESGHEVAKNFLLEIRGY
ncbi:MAG: tetratricopeptide repeat protein [Candidatus Izemoplasmatales bacterium]|nr:tetratricopeptide repeat protein [Candidatus Izemoplasmatales bacterium]MDY0139171.1 tetratricopeptide repeat protein [Candidatus Izemoplasmatales bacterium]